ncbi:MAG: glycoside hydrolase family 127 protein, partial [Kiritimatiellae bacterium]|nr:glycoside hydrolase family 127 protein [Kiritimatiellia bacterium]
WEARDIAGHSLGHYLSALAMMYAHDGDKKAKERCDYIVDELAKCQDKLGTGYVHAEDEGWLNQLERGQVRAQAFNLNGVWVPFYSIHKVFAGLRDAYRLAGNKKALDVERKLADRVIAALNNLNENQVQTMLRAEHGGMLEVMVDLAEDTGDKKYSEAGRKFFFDNRILGAMEEQRDIFNGIHANTQIPKIAGLARLYEVEGDEKAKTGAEYFFTEVSTKRSYANGGHSESEHFYDMNDVARTLKPNTAETCNSYNMVKLAMHMFEWNQNSTPMDFAEKVTLNHIAANIGHEPGEYGYFLSLGSPHYKVFSTEFNSWWCCVGSGMENPERYTEISFATSGDSVAVNQYWAAELNDAKLGLELAVDSKFPLSNKADIVLGLKSAKTFALDLRKPAWAKTMTVKVNGKTVPADADERGYVAISRKWQNGDKVQVEFEFPLYSEVLPDGKHVAFFYGPLLLAAVIPPAEGKADPALRRYNDQWGPETHEPIPTVDAADAETAIKAFKPGKEFGEFTAKSTTGEFTLMPLFNVYHEHYCAYLPLNK